MRLKLILRDIMRIAASKMATMLKISISARTTQKPVPVLFDMTVSQSLRGKSRRTVEGLL